MTKNNKKSRVYFKTFGCRTNMFDSQVMMNKLDNFEITNDENNADVVVINSCTVTNSADTTVRSYVNHINNNTKAKIFLTGCGAHTKGEDLFKDEKIFGVFGQSEKQKIDKLLQSNTAFYELGDLEFVDESIIGEFIGKSRAFIKIQEGCNFRCNYCIIPFVRGDARSMDEERILQQVSKLSSNGFGEFILTGTNVGSYGTGSSTNIARLMKRMSQIRGVRRIRIGSLEPIQINDEFKEILDEPWLERHLHIALQHTSQKMLKIMNRRNRFKQDMELFELLRDKNFALGTDFIVGHPGESEEIWSEAVSNLELLPLTHLHAFSYSKRDKTVSATMQDTVSGDVAKKRLHQITNIVEHKNYQFRLKHNKNLDILVEHKTKNGTYSGLDQYFNKITIQSNEDLSGNWITCNDCIVKDKYNYVQI